MEMHQIRYFLTACETLNFTRAAERCDIAVPSLTRAIHARRRQAAFAAGQTRGQDGPLLRLGADGIAPGGRSAGSVS